MLNYEKVEKDEAPAGADADAQVARWLLAALVAMRRRKVDRVHAVAITMLEQVVAYWDYYVIRKGIDG
jgi:hypothetical protein